MENKKYTLIIPIEEFIDEISLINKESKKFKDKNPDYRINSIGYNELSRDDIEITFDINIEYEI